MAQTRTGPCSWDVDPGGTGCCTGWDDHTPEVQDQAVDLATWWMWAATARRYGLCELTIEACQSGEGARTYRAFPVEYSTGSGGSWVPFMNGGQWFNGGGGSCCESRCAIELPEPTDNADNIISVTTSAGEEITDWVLEDGLYLVRPPGSCWPWCCGSNVTITYLAGVTPPDMLLHATGVLACEFAASCTGGQCRLPRQISAMSQLGVSVDFGTLGNTVGMRTGIADIDSVISTLNPAGLRRPPSIRTASTRSTRTITPGGSM